MGNKNSIFTEEQLENYADTTFLTKAEVLRVLRKFCNIQETPVSKDITHQDFMDIKMQYADLCKCCELKENPFRKRICKVFSSDGQSEELGFNEFLLMFSVFSENAPREMKVHYAFKIYDFDGDNFIGSSDIEATVKLLTQNEMTADEISSIAEGVLMEGDIDGDTKLSPNEFEHVITKSPDFVTTFHFGI